MVKRHNAAATQLLIHWRGLSPADASWEYADELQARLTWVWLDSSADDYKLVRIVYLPGSNFDFDEIPPFVEIYSLRSRGWKKVDNDLKYVITDLSKSAFLNGTFHWVATKPPDKTDVWYATVSFSLGEEVFGEMEVPDCLVEKYPVVDVAVSDGSLLLVVITKLTEEGCFSVWMMKEYGVPGS
ncbi:hypothetical protein GH714_028620 [Hevea brasiliensis]|uniref:F-box associated beta-propeller type 1 domain-containing protein n=1 Tax=Hevea brasiliensis TaxID=3981 RepID=A0A6A6M640_HEVBR|nr:hypothetical protein GH714_028620 [Hevea brasiliensis]